MGRRARLPCGLGQVGKAFRNEISPGNFLFRTREFELMELQWFCDPAESMEWHSYWVEECVSWLRKVGLREDSVRRRE